jgi:ribosomal protein S18 acetylase RimI-like enzyme
MRLQIRLAGPQDHEQIEEMVIASFAPITWARTLDEKFGALNGADWLARWRSRLAKIFAEQIVLVGEVDNALTAMSSSSLDKQAALAYIDLLAVASGRQHEGYGREMLRATMQYMCGLGAQYVHLDCLTNNDKANALYRDEGFEEVARHIRWFRKI